MNPEIHCGTLLKLIIRKNTSESFHYRNFKGYNVGFSQKEQKDRKGKFYDSLDVAFGILSNF